MLDRVLDELGAGIHVQLQHKPGLRHRDVTSMFSKRDGTYFVATDGPDGALHE